MLFGIGASMSLSHDLRHAKDLIELWPSLKASEKKRHFFSLSRSAAEELFLGLVAQDQVQLISLLPAAEIRSWLRFLPPDEAADFIQALPSEERRLKALSMLDEPTKNDVAGLLAYAEDAAGGLMNTEYIRLRPEMSLPEAISYLRAQAQKRAKIYYAYVLDQQQKLLGIVSLREILLESQSKNVKDIMNKDFIFVKELMPAEEVARVFTKNPRLMAIPVLDDKGSMKGVVTHDDIAWEIEKANTEDIQKIGGMQALDAPYFNVGFLELIKKRGGWLMVLFLGEMLTATAMGFYEDEIAKAVVLALFVPLIISSGGNSGSQASTLIIRSLALYEVRLKDWWRVFFRECAFGIVLGLILGIIGLLRIVIWQQYKSMYGEHYLLVGFTVALSLIGVVLWGTLTGSMLPFILRFLKFDPASASAPLVATLVDVTGLIIYFSVASIFLSGVLL
jgi:magnesium transporter